MARSFQRPSVLARDNLSLARLILTILVNLYGWSVHLIGAGIVGVISLTIQVAQVVVQFGQDWKDVPGDAKSLMAELGSLKTALSETNTNTLLNPDFADAFQGRPSGNKRVKLLVENTRLSLAYLQYLPDTSSSP